MGSESPEIIPSTDHKGAPHISRRLDTYNNEKIDDALDHSRGPNEIGNEKEDLRVHHPINRRLYEERVETNAQQLVTANSPNPLNNTISTVLNSDTNITNSGSVEPEDVFDYPEGGLRAWLLVFGSWCGLFASLGVANTLGTFQAYLASSQLSSYTSGQIGWIFSLYTFLLFACGIYIGPLFDVYGPRWLILPGSACVVLTMFLLGACTEYWHFIIVFGVIGGIGTSLLFTPCISAVSHFFCVKRGNATGIAATGGAFGGIVFPLLLESLIPRIGFAWATRVLGFLILFLCVIANALITARLPPSLAGRSPHPDFTILKQPIFALTVFGVFMFEWALFVPLTYITSYALEEGFPEAFSYQILPILNAGSIFGRWLPGFYSDLFGRYNLSILCILLTIVSAFVVWLPFGSTYPGLILFSLLFGFASGSNISLTPVCIGQLCKTEDYGRYYATCYTIVSFGCLTGIPIAGEILQRCGGRYWGLILWTGLCYSVSAVAFVVVRGLGGGWKFSTRY